MRLPFLMVVLVLVGCGRRGAPGASGSVTGVPDGASAAADGAGAGVEAGGPDAAQIVDADAPDASAPDSLLPALAEICGAVPVTLDDWERCYQKRKCEWETQCLANVYRDAQDCIDHGAAVDPRTFVIQRGERRRAIASGRASVNGEAFARCLMETSGQHCRTAFLAVSCLTRLVGTVPDGQACLADVECKSPRATCVRTCTGGCCQGICKRAFREGEACDGFYSCEPGLQCWKTCVAGDIGTPCSDIGHCDPNAWCDLKEGICKATLPEGTPCTSILQCGSQATCVGGGGLERACRRVSQPGDVCEGLCRGPLQCLPSVPGAPHVCTAFSELGEPCDVINPCRGIGNFCPVGIYECQPRQTEGEPCGNGSCMPELYCTSELGADPGVCARRQAAGQPCNRDNQCESFQCSGDTKTPGVCLAWAESCPTTP